MQTKTTTIMIKTNISNNKIITINNKITTINVIMTTISKIMKANIQSMITVNMATSKRI